MEGAANIVLAGFMATGKSAVGRILAARLGREFLDLDALIEAEAGASIPEIFAREGEAGFRAREAAAAAAAAARRRVVIATGGGAILDPRNLAAFRAGGLVVTLTADAETILGRIARVEERPMLRGGDPRERVGCLMAGRAAAYARADLLVETAGRDPEGVAAEIATRLAARGPGGGEPGMRTVRVDLAGRGYEVQVGARLLERLGELTDRLGLGRRVGVVTHPLLLERYGYGALVRESLLAAGREVVCLTVPPGEGSKSLEEVGRLARELVRGRLDRGSALVAVGGGVLGDLVGFVAATLFRGISFVNVPTTLLAQVDSSVGGKTGVNLPEGKNLLGAFHQPRLVVADVGSLATLPEREYRSGLAELVKHAMIADAALFGRLEAEAAGVLARDPGRLEELVARSIAIKAAVVEEDEREGGRRAILNFGHTVGHALEAAAGYGGLTHGEAVAWGMLVATRLSIRRGLCPVSDLARLRRLLGRLGLLEAPLPRREMLEKYIVSDKKMRDGVLQFVLTPGVGSVTLAPVSDPDEIRAALSELDGRDEPNA